MASCRIEPEGSPGTLRLELPAMETTELPNLIRILVALEPVDRRKGIDSLAQLCREKLAADPFLGCLFTFKSRRTTSIHILTYDGQEFWLAQKRLSKESFPWWPSDSGTACRLEAYQA